MNTTPVFTPACAVCLGGDVVHFAQIKQRRYWRCNECEATFLDPAQLPDREIELKEYHLHENAVDDPGYRRFLSRIADPLLERLPPESRGLDYGCGPGPALATMLNEAGHHMEVYDPLFFDDPCVLGEGYEFITCTEVVEHFHRPAEEFTRLDGMLADGGCLAIMTHFQTDDAAFAGWHYRRDPTHVVFYRESTFHWIAQHRGWRCEIPRPNVVFLYKSGRPD